MRIKRAFQFDQRPTLREVQKVYQKTKKFVWVLSFGLTFIFIIAWPLLMTLAGDYSIETFKFWIIIGHVFTVISFIFTGLGPFVPICNRLFCRYRS